MEAERRHILFIVDFGRALHQNGAAAHRIENAVSALANRLGLRCEVMSTPTSILMGIGEAPNQSTVLTRVEPGEHDLARLSALGKIAEDLAHGALSFEDASASLKQAQEDSDHFGWGAMVAAFSIVSAAAAVLFGGGVAEMAVAAFTGLSIGVLSLFSRRTSAGGHIFEVVAAALASAFSLTAIGLGVKVNFNIAMLAGVIVLIPGLTLTIAMVELATRHLVSGTARLTIAFVVFLEILFGVAVSEQVCLFAFGEPPIFEPASLPWYSEWLALASACPAVAVLFKAAPKDILIITITACSAFYCAKLGSSSMNSVVGAGFGGFVAAGISNVYARVRNKSALVPLVPGLLLLVPGSLGFKSFTSFWQQDITGGVNASFQMVVVAVALTFGILVANAVFVPRSSL